MWDPIGWLLEHVDGTAYFVLLFAAAVMLWAVPKILKRKPWRPLRFAIPAFGTGVVLHLIYYNWAYNQTCIFQGGEALLAVTQRNWTTMASAWSTTGRWGCPRCP